MMAQFKAVTIENQARSLMFAQDIEADNAVGPNESLGGLPQDRADTARLGAVVKQPLNSESVFYLFWPRPNSVQA